MLSFADQHTESELVIRKKVFEALRNCIDFDLDIQKNLNTDIFGEISSLNDILTIEIPKLIKIQQWCIAKDIYPDLN